MASLPDKIFHDKLADYQRPAPPVAWQRIEKGLDHSKGFTIFFKVAAAVLVIVIAGYIVWSLPAFKGESNQVITSNSPDHPSKLNHGANTSPETFEEPVTPKNVVIPSVSDDTNVVRNSIVTNNNNREKTSERYNTRRADALSNKELQPSTVEEIKTIDITASETEENVNREFTSQKIVYSVEYAQNKFLKKNTPSLKAVEKEPVKKQKATEVAYGVAHSIKNSEIGIGDLRQIKDEFFALDFLADSDKTTKNKN